MKTRKPFCTLHGNKDSPPLYGKLKIEKYTILSKHQTWKHIEQGQDSSVLQAAYQRLRKLMHLSHCAETIHLGCSMKLNTLEIALRVAMLLSDLIYENDYAQ